MADLRRYCSRIENGSFLLSGGGQGPLPFSSTVSNGSRLLRNFPKMFHLLPELDQFLLQMRCLGFGFHRLRPVSGVQCIQIGSMLSSICFIRCSSLWGVKFLSRLLTALNLLPSMAMMARVNRLSWRHIATKRLQALRIPLPLSRRKSAIVLKSGASRPVSHISSTLRCASRSKRRLD